MCNAVRRSNTIPAHDAASSAAIIASPGATLRPGSRLTSPRKQEYFGESRPATAHGLASYSLVSVTDTIEGLDHVKAIVHHLELPAQPLDVAIDRAVVNIDLIVIGRLHQGVSAPDHPWATRQRV